MNKTDYKIEIDTNLKDNKRNITIVDRKIIRDSKNRMWKYYKYKCNKCGFDCTEHYSLSDKKYKDELWIEQSNLVTHKKGCSCCNAQPKIVVKGINDIATTNPEMIKYFKNTKDIYTHTYASNEKVLMRCPDCGFEKEMIINNLSKREFSCNKCGDGFSYPNKFMLNVLEQLHIDFETEYNPEWIKPKKYDFYIPSMNLIIEMDGGLGHGKDKHSKSKISIEESKAIDDYKDEKALAHGIEIIRIDCDYGSDISKRFDYIKQNILNGRLNKVFNLDKTNWSKANEYALNNLIKIACDIKLNNPNIKTKQICEILKISIFAITKYLKIGNDLGWCYYNGKEEISKAHKGIKTGKSVEVIKDGISKGIFNSLSELERLSKDLFGIYFEKNSVSNVCNKKQKSYKGFIFKFL